MGTKARPELNRSCSRIESTAISFHLPRCWDVCATWTGQGTAARPGQGSPGQSRPCCYCPQVSYSSIPRTTTGEFSVFCAFLKWANLCDTLRQLIKLNKHEAEPRRDTEREKYIYRKRWNGKRDSDETEQSRRKIPFPFLTETREIVKLLQELNVKLVIYFLNQRSAFCALSWAWLLLLTQKEKHKIHA